MTGICDQFDSKSCKAWFGALFGALLFFFLAFIFFILLSIYNFIFGIWVRASQARAARELEKPASSDPSSTPGWVSDGAEFMPTISAIVRMHPKYFSFGKYMQVMIERKENFSNSENQKVVIDQNYWRKYAGLQNSTTASPRKPITIRAKSQFAYPLTMQDYMSDVSDDENGGKTSTVSNTETSNTTTRSSSQLRQKRTYNKQTGDENFSSPQKQTREKSKSPPRKTQSFTIDVKTSKTITIQKNFSYREERIVNTTEETTTSSPKAEDSAGEERGEMTRGGGKESGSGKDNVYEGASRPKLNIQQDSQLMKNQHLPRTSFRGDQRKARHRLSPVHDFDEIQKRFGSDAPTNLVSINEHAAGISGGSARRTRLKPSRKKVHINPYPLNIEFSDRMNTT